MEKDTDRPSSPIITEEGIKWRIESPPNRHIEETDRREKLANTNGKGIKKEDSILVDDPVMPWAEDEYDNTVLLSNSNNPINSQSIVKEQNVISSTTNTEKKSFKSTKKSFKSKKKSKSNTNNNNSRNVNNNNNNNSNNTTNKDSSNKKKNKETLDDFKTSHPARSSKKSDKESVSSSPSSSPINFKQPNITSNVNLSPKIAETLKSESPTSEIIRFRNNQRAPSPTKSNISNPRSRSPSPSQKLNKKKKILNTGGIDGGHSGIIIQNRNNMGTKKRKKILQKQPNKEINNDSDYVRNNMSGLKGKPLLEWYGENLLDGYDLALPSTDSLVVSEDAFLNEEERLRRINGEVNGEGENNLIPPHSHQKQISAAYRRLPIDQSNVDLYSQMHIGSSQDGESYGEYDNNSKSNKLQMTPNIVKPPITHERGIPGPLYFQTSGFYDALIAQTNDNTNGTKQRPNTTPNRDKPTARSMKTPVQEKPKVLNIMYDPKLDMSRTAPLPPHLAEHKIKADLAKEKNRRRPRTMEGYRRKNKKHSDEPDLNNTVVGGSGYLPSLSDMDKRRLLRKQMGLPEEKTANEVDEAEFENEYKSWAVEVSMPSTTTLTSDEDEFGDDYMMDSKNDDEGKYSDIGSENNNYKSYNPRIPYYALLQQRSPFHVDKTGADGSGVPIGFSDRRHKMALARKQVIDEEFMFAVRLRRKEKRKEIKRRKKYQLKLNSQNRRKSSNALNAKDKFNKDKIGTVGQRIALNSFVDSSGADIMMFAMPPPLPPGAPPWPWEAGASDFDGSSTLDPSSKSSSDMALARAREAAKEGERLASELQIMNLSDSSEPDTPPDSEGTARSSVLSEDEDPPPPCYPARRWEKMTPELQMLEAEISCWESDVRDACTVDELDYALPEDFVRESKKNKIEGEDSSIIEEGDANDDSDEDDEATKKRKARESSERLKEYIEWFSKNDGVRATFMDQEIRGAIMHVPIQSAAAIEGIDIDLLRKYEEGRRDSGLTARLHLRDKWEAGPDEDGVLETEEDYDEAIQSAKKEKLLLDIAEGLEDESLERRTHRAIRIFVKWYRKHKYLRREFLNYRNTLLKRAVDKLVRWGRNRTIITLDPFGPMVDELTVGGEIGVPWDDLTENEKEMEIMSALCDKHIRKRAEDEGIPLPPVFGVIDGTGLDTTEEIEFAMWFATADGVRFDFFMREMEAAMKNNDVIAAAAEDEIIKDDAETMDVVVPTTITDKHGNVSIEGENEENVTVILEKKSNLEHDGDPQTVKEEFKEWLTSEDDIIPYTVEVKEKKVEDGEVEEGLSIKISLVEDTVQEVEEGTNQASIEEAKKMIVDNEDDKITTSEGQEKPGDKKIQKPTTSAKATEQKKDEKEAVQTKEVDLEKDEVKVEEKTEEDTVPAGTAKEVAKLPARDRRGAPLGKRRTFQEFKSWYINDHESRKRFLENRRTLFRNALKQRARSKHGYEIPDIWADDLDLEDYEDDCTLQEAQDYADEKSWYIDRWEALGWYSNKKLEEDDKIMRAMEHKARRKLDREKRRAFNANVAGLLEVGMVEFEGDYLVEENKGGFVENVPDSFEMPEGWDNGSGLLNNDEAYFAMKEKEEAEREFIRQEKLREKQANEDMAREEKERRAYLFRIQLELLESANNKAIMDEVHRQRRLTLERYRDPYGRTLKEKELEDRREAEEERLRLEQEKIERNEKRNGELMEMEDDLAYEVREEFLKEEEEKREREVKRKEKQIMMREINEMAIEDDLAMAIIVEEERILAAEEHQARLKAIMNVQWKPTMEKDENPILFKPYGLEDKRVFNIPYFPQVSRIERVLPPVQTGPKRFSKSRGSSRHNLSRGSSRTSLSRGSSRPTLSRPNSRQSITISLNHNKRPNTSPVRTRPHTLMMLQKERNKPKDLSPLVNAHMRKEAFKEEEMVVKDGENEDEKIKDAIEQQKQYYTRNRKRGGIRGSKKQLNRPSTTPLRSRQDEWGNNYEQKMAQPGLPEVRLRKEPRLGALGIKKKISRKTNNMNNNTLKGNQDNNRYGTRPKSGASDMSTKERRWGGEIKQW